jgi:hypothetical protein
MDLSRRVGCVFRWTVLGILAGFALGALLAQLAASHNLEGVTYQVGSMPDPWGKPPSAPSEYRNANAAAHAVLGAMVTLGLITGLGIGFRRAGTLTRQAS